MVKTYFILKFLKNRNKATKTKTKAIVAVIKNSLLSFEKPKGIKPISPKNENFVSLFVSVWPSAVRAKPSIIVIMPIKTIAIPIGINCW